MARHFAPVVPPNDPRECAPWLNRELRRIGSALTQQSQSISAVARGEAPDASGSPLVDLSGVFLLAGRIGNQQGAGGTSANGTLTLTSTTSPTKGFIYLGVAGAPNGRIAFDETNCFTGFGIDTPTARTHMHLLAAGTTTIGNLGTHYADYTVVVGGNTKNILTLAAYQNNGGSYDVAFVSGGTSPATALGSIIFTDSNAGTGSATGLRFAYGTFASDTIKAVHLQLGALDSGGLTLNRNLILLGINDVCGDTIDVHFNYLWLRSIDGAGALSNNVLTLGVNDGGPQNRTGTAQYAQPCVLISAKPSVATKYDCGLAVVSNISFPASEGASAKTEIMQWRTSESGGSIFAVDRWGRLNLYNPGNNTLTSRISGRRSTNGFLLEDGTTGVGTPNIEMEFQNSNAWSDGAAKNVWQMRFGFVQTSVLWSIMSGVTQAASSTPTPFDRLGLNAKQVFICAADVAPGGSFTPPTGMLHIKNTHDATAHLLRLQRFGATQTGDFATLLESDGTTNLAKFDQDANLYIPGLPNALVDDDGNVVTVDGEIAFSAVP